MKKMFFLVSFLLIFILNCGEEAKKPDPKPEPPKKEVKEDVKEPEKEEVNAVDDMIKKAKQLGDEEKKYEEALEILNKAKKYEGEKPGQDKKVKPTPEQLKEIDELIEKYTRLLKESKKAKIVEGNMKDVPQVWWDGSLWREHKY
ncbi:MAG: hypothetical protein OEV44_09320 [Spirochaetota bacterium]|nr:hypothetical protein [Spirochaetota bacterium]